MKSTKVFVISVSFLCLLALSALSLQRTWAQGTKTNAQPTGKIKAENKAKLPPTMEIVRCPEWLKVNFDESQTFVGWKTFMSYTTRATEARIAKGPPGKETLQCIYGGAPLEREVPANTCKVAPVTDGTIRSFECSW